MGGAGIHILGSIFCVCRAGKHTSVLTSDRWVVFVSRCVHDSCSLCSFMWKGMRVVYVGCYGFLVYIARARVERVE